MLVGAVVPQGGGDGRGAAFEDDSAVVGVAPEVAESGRDAPVEIEPQDGRSERRLLAWRR